MSNLINKLVYVQVRNRYGKEVYVPDCDFTRLIAQLKGTKEITDADIRIIKSKGIAVVKTTTVTVER